MAARPQLGGRAHPADRAGHPLRAAPPGLSVRRSPNTSSRPVMPTWWAARAGFFADPEYRVEGEGRTWRGHPPLHRPEHLHDDRRVRRQSRPPRPLGGDLRGAPRREAQACPSTAAGGGPAGSSKRLASPRSVATASCCTRRPTNSAARSASCRRCPVVSTSGARSTGGGAPSPRISDLGAKVHLGTPGSATDVIDAETRYRRHRSDLRPHRVNGLRQRSDPGLRPRTSSTAETRSAAIRSRRHRDRPRRGDHVTGPRRRRVLAQRGAAASSSPPCSSRSGSRSRAGGSTVT